MSAVHSGWRRSARRGDQSGSSGTFSTPEYKELKAEMFGQTRGLKRKGAARLVHDSDIGNAHFGRGGGAARTQMMDNFLPVQFVRTLGRYPSRVYGGKFTEDGSMFIASSQDECLRVYDTRFSQEHWKLLHVIEANDIYWAITDTDVSPSKRHVIYSSLGRDVHMVDLDNLESGTRDFNMRVRGGILGLRFSSDGTEIVAGANDSTIRVFDIERNRLAMRVQGHGDDVNSVCFLDESRNLLVSGSDDHCCFLWDRRAISANDSPCAVLAGHLAGITHVSSKGDGRYIISNSKDQSLKLWDIRKLTSTRDYASYAPESDRHIPEWDYRISTTAQKYIYTGSFDGSVVIYDILTGKIVRSLRYHNSVVRDVSWHPVLPYLCSSSWDITVAIWGPRLEDEKEPGDKERGADKCININHYFSPYLPPPDSPY